jgi:pyridinium-3,5-biscarboxylic acid mononucleotide synthase
MDPTDLEQLLLNVANGTCSPHEAAQHLARLPFEDIGVARIDHHRTLRQGFPEAVYAPGKRTEDVRSIVRQMLASGSGPIVITRADADQVDVCEKVGLEHDLDAIVTPGPAGATVVLRPAPDRGRRVIVVTAGTADQPVADECEATLRAVGLTPTVLRDRGVAGLHRLTSDLDILLEAEGTVVVAGMEGALASVVGGLVRGPIVAVPTSAGYGASLEGVTALLGMLSSCAAGISVVGIDNGFGAAMALTRALDQRSQRRND